MKNLKKRLNMNPDQNKKMLFPFIKWHMMGILGRRSNYM